MVRIDDLDDPHWTRLLVAMQESEMNRRNFVKTAAAAPVAAGAWRRPPRRHAAALTHARSSG